MAKNMRHLTSVHEASQELHKRLLGLSWYINVQVMAIQPEKDQAAIDKGLKQEIVVFVRTAEDLKKAGMSTFNSWPVRYEIGA